MVQMKFWYTSENNLGYAIKIRSNHITRHKYHVISNELYLFRDVDVFHASKRAGTREHGDNDKLLYYIYNIYKKRVTWTRTRAITLKHYNNLTTQNKITHHISSQQTSKQALVRNLTGQGPNRFD
ncbi:hypothetical protein ACJX0J_037962, partial [Zea mays]